MAFKDRLRQARKERKLSQGDIADGVGVTTQAVSGWERGESNPEMDKLNGIARMVGKTVDWLTEGESANGVGFDSESDTGRRIPVKGYVGATGEAHFYDLTQGDFDEIQASTTDPANAAAVQIRGSSLGRLFDRWYAVFDDIRSPVTDDLIGKGKLCVVELDDGRVLIKEIKRNGKKFDLISNDSREPPIKNVGITWAARVTRLGPR